MGGFGDVRQARVSETVLIRQRHGGLKQFEELRNLDAIRAIALECCLRRSLYVA